MKLTRNRKKVLQISLAATRKTHADTGDFLPGEHNENDKKDEKGNGELKEPEEIKKKKNKENRTGY